MKRIDDIESLYWQPMLGEPGSVMEGFEEISQAIRIILTTPRGSVSHNPDFGSNIWKYLDYPIHEATPNIIREAIDAIALWEPRVTIKSIKARTDVSNVILSIEWILKETGEAQLMEVII